MHHDTKMTNNDDSEWKKLLKIIEENPESDEAKKILKISKDSALNHIYSERITLVDILSIEELQTRIDEKRNENKKENKTGGF